MISIRTFTVNIASACAPATSIAEDFEGLAKYTGIIIDREREILQPTTTREEH